MANERFFLNFLSDDYGKHEISEPVGYNSLSFDLMQKDKGFGRDIVFNSGESQLEFVSRLDHQFEKLIYYNQYFGYESIVELEINFPNGEIVIHEIDFAKAQTDDLEYFRCKVIQKSSVQVVKRREAFKVDLFSNKDADNNPITPLTPTKILLKPKSIFQVSKWSQPPFDNVYMKSQGSSKTEIFHVNPCRNIVQSDIKNTLTFFNSVSNPPQVEISNGTYVNPYFIIQAASDMVKVKVEVKGIHLNITTDTDNGGQGYVKVKFRIIYGKDLDHATRKDFYDIILDTDQGQSVNYIQPAPWVVEIDKLNNGDKIWVLFIYELRQSSSLPTGRSEAFTTITGMETIVTAETTTYYSVAQGVRLLDAIKQVVKSISGLSVSAPIFDIGSVYYNTYLLNGNLFRGIKDKPFSLSLEDISKSITECNADYEIGETVFFGNESAFYTSIECGFFDNIQFQEFSKTFNERMMINRFEFNYSKYQALKENELPQTADTVHGESKVTLFNKNVENSKEAKVEWIRDSFLIEEARAKALTIDPDTSYQDDDTIFALDTFITTSNKEYEEITELRHQYEPTPNTLTLNTNTLNFVLMGIEIGTSFKILAPDPNAGTYSVVTVSPNTITLVPIAASPTTNNNGVRFTTYSYTILFTSVPLTNYTNEGITNIDGISGQDSYSNLRFSIQRNIINYYSPYLATCNEFWKDKPLITTWYKNNRKFTCTFNGLTTLEGQNITPTNKILSSYKYENVVFANVELDEFFLLQNKIRTDRGFIRVIDKTNNVIKLYPTKMSYEVMSKELIMDAEVKFEPAQMTISTSPNYILINNETSLTKVIYEIKEDKLFIYDNQRQLLYNSVYWNKVQINGFNPKTIQELDNLMKLLQ